MSDVQTDTHQQPNALETLLEAGLIGIEQAAEASAAAAAESISPLRWLVSRGIVAHKKAVEAIAKAAGYEYIDLPEVLVEQSALESLTGRDARRLAALPVRLDGDTLVLAVPPSAPENPFIQADLARALPDGQPITFVIAVKQDILARISAEYRAESELSDLSDQVGQTDAEDTTKSITDVSEATEKSAVAKLADGLIHQAIADGASDIHIDPGEKDVVIRYRIDDVLKVVNRFEARVKAELTSRIKIMADLDVAERRRPQDGRLSVVLESGKKVDLRLATLPTVHGEKIVMRVLDNSHTLLSLEDLGFSTVNEQVFRDAYTRPYGAILVTGPTGSGKSTTLYAALNQVARPEINVITVENPVEYRIPGIAQVEVDVKAGRTFSSVLRSILRSDPNVVLIGEIRDQETAKIAMEAAMTGHLVLSTLHTNDAPSAITRLTEMGIEPFLVGASVSAVLAQRLVRRLCARCKEAYEPERETLMALGFPLGPDDPTPTLHRPVGCQYCHNTGYRGRMALHEVMTVDAEVERLAVAGEPLDTITNHAVESGMVPLRQDGWLKVMQGKTSIEDVLRVVI